MPPSGLSIFSIVGRLPESRLRQRPESGCGRDPDPGCNGFDGVAGDGGPNCQIGGERRAVIVKEPQEANRSDVSWPRPAVSIIIVSFNTKDLLIKCLASIRRYPPSVPCEVIVVDNGSHDGSPDAVERGFPEVSVIRNGENLGFGAANNRGLRDARGEIILFMNSDTELLPTSLEPLLDRLAQQSDVGIVGPTEQLHEGTPYPTICPAPDFRYVFLTHTKLRYRWYWNPRINPYRLMWECALASGQPVRVDWLSGASLMVRRAVLDQVGAFDEGYFMYMEETDLCERVRRAGWGVEYVPAGRIIHHGGGATNKVKRGVLTLSGAVSELRYFAKHRSRGELLLLKGFLFMEFLSRLAVSGLTDPRRWACREVVRMILGLRPVCVTRADIEGR